VRPRAVASVTRAGFALLVLACSSSNPAREPLDGGTRDGTSDAHERLDGKSGVFSQDASPSDDADESDDGEASTEIDAPNPCSSTQLWCGGICVPNDFVNCGKCDNDCTDLHSTSTPSCTAGQCAFPRLTCAADWAHCTSSTSSGCETDLSKPGNCGACGTVCSASPICAMAAGAFSCTTATAVAAGDAFTVAVLADGTAQSWGNNSGGLDATQFGQLGTGSSDLDSGVPAPVSPLSAAPTTVAAGDGHACALLSDGTVECWGDNTWGQLGTDPNATSNTLTPVAVAGLKNVIALAAGAVHTCALISGGTVECWGSNDFGELGNGTATKCNDSDKCSAKPVPVSNLSNVTAIAIGADAGTGADHSCALLTDGTVECWGYNVDGDLGNGAVTNAGVAKPGAVTGVAGAVAVTARSGGGCALLSGGGVQCWGSDGQGQLGNGKTNTSPTAVAVSNLTDAIALSVGSTANSVCAVRSNGTGVCWGDNGNGQLGGGLSTSSVSKTPIPITGLTNLIAVGVGSYHACALLATGAIDCWGSDGANELANATAALNDNPTPLPVQW
jgi:alpha-tubulin suppressor-like RCC1 family protein